MGSVIDPHKLPVVDLSGFDAGDRSWRQRVAAQVDQASCSFGSSQIVGHGVESSLMETLAELNSKLFGQGFPGDEISFGPATARARGRGRARQVGRSRQNVLAFPELPGLNEAVEDYLTAMTGLGHKLMTTFARGLGLQDSYFVDHYTGNPDTLLRVITHSSSAARKPTRAPRSRRPAAGELLTLVRPDDAGGLELWFPYQRLEVDAVPGALVCHVGPALERMSCGRYPATRHHLRSTSSSLQLSLVFSFDPGVALVPEPICEAADLPGTGRFVPEQANTIRSAVRSGSV